MNKLPLFGLSVLMSFVAFGIVTRTYIWPRLRLARREEALIALTVPHTFRFIGLSFLIPGVVSSSLPLGFSFPAAYGDLFAAILAVLGIWSLSARVWFAISLVWVFNVWGAVDLLVAFYQGLFGVNIDPGWLSAAYFIQTVLVPPLFVTHGLMFSLLLRKQRSAAPSRAARPVDDRKWNGRPILGVNVLKQPYERPTQEPNHTESRLTNEIHDPVSDCKATSSDRSAITVRGLPRCARRCYT